MKINEVTEASKYAAGDEGATQYDKIKRVQQMKRAGVDTKDAARDIGRSQYAGIDPEDLQGKKIISKSKRDLEDYKAELEKQAGIKDSQRKKREEEERRKQERASKRREKELDKRTRAEKERDEKRRFDKDVAKKSADRRGLRRGSAEPLLRPLRSADFLATSLSNLRFSSLSFSARVRLSSSFSLLLLALSCFLRSSSSRFFL